MDTEIVKYDGNTMTSQEVSKVLNVTVKTVLKYAGVVCPNTIKNGVRTLFNESDVTLIKLELDKNQHLEQSVKLPKTDLEKELIIQQAMSFQAEKINKLQTKNEELETELKEAQPKIEFHDQVGDSEGLYNIGEVAKMLNLGYGRNTFFKNLREMKIFFNTEPYQKYINQGYFQVKSTVKNDHTQKQAFVTGKGMQWLQKRFNSKSPLQLIF